MCAVLRAVAADFFFSCWCLEIPSDNRKAFNWKRSRIVMLEVEAVPQSCGLSIDGVGTGLYGSQSRQGKGIFLYTTQRPDRVWDSRSPLCDGYRWWSGWVIKLTTSPSALLRDSGVIPPCHHGSLWNGIQLIKRSGDITFCLQQEY
jgi:hypothetical protein